jgi:tripartite-type tricarboxylate transporter receptor subunit TctC
MTFPRRMLCKWSLASIIVVCIAALAATIMAARYAAAQTPAEFYKGRTIELGISSAVGGGYDAHARMLARHMSKYIPGHPTIVPKNLEGAGGLRLANMLYNTAPRDGTSFATMYRATTFEPLFGNKAAQFDASRFTWIGSASSEVSVCVSWHTSGIANHDDLRTVELVVAHGGASTDAYQFPKIINGVLGTRMRPVGGYRGGNEMLLAMERGEVGGRCGWSWSSVQATRREWIARKKVNFLMQLALGKHPDLPDVPLVLDLARTAEQRSILKLVFARQQIAYPFLAPPGVPQDRAAVLRSAFLKAMADPALLAEATKARLEIMPMSGREVQRLVTELHATPAVVVHQIVDMLK